MFPTKFKKLRIWGLFAGHILFAVSLQACLAGGDGASAPQQAPVDYVARGDSCYRERRFADAIAAYDTALLQDSSRSRAYYGSARAALMLHGVSGLDLLADLQATNDNPTQFAFLNHPDSILTQRLSGGGAALRMLRRLVDRDTLTRWWKYADDTVTAQESADPQYAVRRAFMLDYFEKASHGDVGYRKRESFPLSDLKLPRENILTDMTTLELMWAITRIYDLDRNDTIDARDSLMRKLQLGSGGIKVDSLAGDLENDTAATTNLNDLIKGIQPGSLIDLIRYPDSGSGGTSPNVDSLIVSLGDAILFYQFGDKIDNDGDGCIDEEILDGKDNDLDGFVDEDARVISSNKPDGVDNDRDGTVDGAGEGTVGVEGNASQPWLLGFVNAYATANPGSPFVKIRKDDATIALRIAVQKDSLATRSPSELAGPYKAKLDSAKALVGGCWRSYP
jgi:hypothetical protein